MKRLWLSIVLLLAVVSNAKESPVESKETNWLEKTEASLKQKEYFPLYDSGCVVDSASVLCIEDAIIVENMYSIVHSLIEAAKRDSVNIKINSAYRSFEKQFECRQRFVRNKRLRGDTTFLLTADSKHFRPRVAKPGYSKHQAGTAFDFNTRDKQVYKWLIDNAFKYGFVRTVRSEKWHWEYLPGTSDPYCYVPQDHRSWKIKNAHNRSKTAADNCAEAIVDIG